MRHIAILAIAVAVAPVGMAEDWRYLPTWTTDAGWYESAAYALRTPSIMVGNDAIYAVGTRDGAPYGSVSAIDPANGTTRWSWQPSYSKIALIEHVVPCASGGVIVAGSREATDLSLGGGYDTAWIARVDPDGVTRWQVDVAAGLSDQAVVGIANISVSAQCAVVFTTGIGAPAGRARLLSLDGDDGRIRWEVAYADLGVEGLVSIHAGSAGTVAAGIDGDNRLRVALIDLASGAVRWARTVPPEEPEVPAGFVVGFAERPAGQIAIATESLGIAAYAVRVHRFDAGDGQYVGASAGAMASRPRQFVVHDTGSSVASDDAVLRFDAGGLPIGTRSYPGARATAVLENGDVLVGAQAGEGTIFRLHAEVDDQVRWSIGMDATPPAGFALSPGSGIAVSHGRSGPWFSRVIGLQAGTLGPWLQPRVEAAAARTFSVASPDALYQARIQLDAYATTLEVTRIARATGLPSWTRRIERPVARRHEHGFVAAHIRPDDGSLLVAASAERISTSPGDPGDATGFLVRLSDSDGAILEEAADQHEWRPTALVGRGTDVYVQRVRAVGSGSAGGEVIERLTGVTAAWRLAIDGGSGIVGPVSLLTASQQGLVVLGATFAPQRHLLRRSDGGTLWSVPSPAATTRMFTAPAGDVYMLTRRDGPGAFLDVGVERIDPSNGLSLWTTFLEGMAGWWDADPASSLALDDGVVVGWDSAANPLGFGRRRAVAKVDRDGAVVWQRLLHAGAPDWSTDGRAPIRRPDGTLLIPIIAMPHALVTALPEFGAHSLVALSPSDGTILSQRPLRSVFERGARGGDGVSALLDATHSHALLTMSLHAPGLPRVVGAGSVSFAGPPASKVALTGTALEIPGERRRLRLQLAASANDVPPGTSATVSIALPYGMIAAGMACEGTNVRCDPSRRIGVVQQPMIWSGDATASIIVDAEAFSDATILGPMRAVLDIDAVVDGGDLGSRIVEIPWTLAPPASAAFLDGFESSPR